MSMSVKATPPQAVPDISCPETHTVLIDSRTAGAPTGSALLTDSQRDWVARLRRQQDKQTYARSHVELRMWLAQVSGSDPRELVFGRLRCPRCGGRNGRPVLSRPAGLTFSLSRSEHMIALARGTGPIGIDIQARPRISHSYVVAALHEDEVAEINTYPASEQPQALGRCWVRKEAVLKAAGMGLGHGVRAPYVGAGLEPAAVEGAHLVDLAAPRGFTAAVAVIVEPAAINRWTGAIR